MKINRSEPNVIACNHDAYSAFPDIVYFNNRFLCIYRESDTHHPTVSSLVLLKSDDGLTWTRETLFTANLESDRYVFNCPRLSVVKNRLALVCDTKNSQIERECSWNNYLWWSSNGDTWSARCDMMISGMVPDKIIQSDKRLIMGYHVSESVGRHRLVQMMAVSLDDGLTWRDRTTVAISDKHDFCEGSIVKINKKLFCYLRDNRGPMLRSQYVASIDNGLTWTLPSKLEFIGHRIVAGIKEKEPYKGLVVGTFRNTFNRNISLFLHNLKQLRMQIFHLDVESRDSLYDFGYTGWAENEEGELLVVYYIQRHHLQPMICSTLVKLL